MTVAGVIPEGAEIEVVEQKPREEEQEPPKPYFGVDGPPLPEDFKVNEKKMKKVVKEGGKRGVEIEGAADMGGLQFFATKVEEPAGDMTYLMESMKAMNAKSDPTEEERKGGAGNIGKIMMGTDPDNKFMSLIAYVPSNLTSDITAKAWLEETVGLILEGLPKEVAEFSSCGDVSTDNYFKCKITADPEKNVFILKFRDVVITFAYNVLKKKNLFPEDDEDDDDDFVFGDEDFPS